jgi:UDP-3-O-[3-hydroxymyristoyl] glucosamine N-acyltransferase
MYRLKQVDIWASDIAHYLNAELVGADAMIRSVQSIKSLESLQASNGRPIEESWLAIIPLDTTEALPPRYILSDNPQRDIARVFIEFFATPEDDGVHPAANISSDAVLGRGLRIGAHSTAKSGVEIGDHCWIMSNVVIHGPARLGRNTVVKDGAVIGSEAYGFIKDERGHWIHAPQFGRVLIGENVWIGANSTIERGMLEDTVLEDEVKIDDLVHIGKGCLIGRGALITAGCVLAYDVKIGKGVQLAPNAAVREHVCIADNAIVGIGSVVLSDIVEPGVYVGVPAKRIDRGINRRKS